MVGKGGGAGFQDCPLSLELNPEKTPWSAVFPLFGRLRRDAAVEHMAGVSKLVGTIACIDETEQRVHSDLRPDRYKPNSPAVRPTPP